MHTITGEEGPLLTVLYAQLRPIWMEAGGVASAHGRRVQKAAPVGACRRALGLLDRQQNLPTSLKLQINVARLH